MFRIRSCSVSIRRETTSLNYALNRPAALTKNYQKVLQIHSEIWRISGEILHSLKKRGLSRDTITIVSDKSVHLIDSFDEYTPP